MLAACTDDLNSLFCWWRQTECFTYGWPYSGIKSGFKSIVVLLTHLTFCTVDPCTNFLILTFFLPPVISWEHFLSINPRLLSLKIYLDKTFHRFLFLIHPPNSTPSSSVSLLLHRDLYIVEVFPCSQQNQNDRQREQERRRRRTRRRRGELSLSWLLVVFLSMNQSPVVSDVWTNNIPSDLTSKTAL